MSTLLIASFYGEIPAHIRVTFGMDRAGCPYEVIRQGEKIPDEWEQAVILHGTNGYDALQGAQLQVQLKALNPTGIVFMLPVEIEHKDATSELRSAIDVASRQYRSGFYIP